jgi:cytochrome c biogenesis protein CcmG/thiol:disulfide interchange protein DsbE
VTAASDPTATAGPGGERPPGAEPDAAEVARRRRMRLLLGAPVAIFLALAALFLARLNVGGDPSAIPSVLVGRPAPATTLPPLEGLVRDGVAVPGLAPADFAGRATLVNVFASWCGPCRIEHPLLMRLAEDPELSIVGINNKDQPENARRFLGALGNPYAAVGADANGRASIEWGVYGVPETFVVGPDGTILYKHIGPISEAALAGPFGAAITAAKQAAAARPPG